jgi:nitrate reductase delta subunit
VSTAAAAASAAANRPRRPWRFGAFRQDAAQVSALERVKAWSRESLALAAGDTILVAEMVCGRPDCPPLETVVTFWLAGAERHMFKVFKPVAEVAFDDLPPAWLRESLYASDPVDGGCC